MSHNEIQTGEMVFELDGFDNLNGNIDIGAI